MTIAVANERMVSADSHPAACWPHSLNQVISQFSEAGIPAADRQKVICRYALKTSAL